MNRRRSGCGACSKEHRRTHPFSVTRRRQTLHSRIRWACPQCPEVVEQSNLRTVQVRCMVSSGSEHSFCRRRSVATHYGALATHLQTSNCHRYQMQARINALMSVEPPVGEAKPNIAPLFFQCSVPNSHSLFAIFYVGVTQHFVHRSP